MGNKKERGFDFISHVLEHSIGGGQRSQFRIDITPFRKEGTTQVAVELTLTKWFDIKDIKKAHELYEKIQQFRFDLEKVVNGG